MLRIHTAILMGILCNIFLNFALCQHQPEVASFGDYMESLISVHVACANATDGKNKVAQIQKNFAICTSYLAANAREAFDNLLAICENEEKYLKCWDQFKVDIVRNCKETAQLPAVYIASVKSVCGNDKGITTISTLTKSFGTITEDDQNNCPEETGIHWLDNCKSLLESMISDDLCERHNALDKCLQKITCMNMEFGRTSKQVYTGARAYLGTKCTSTP